MGPANIHGSEYSIERVFSKDFVFRIPRYQRPYAWGTEQAGDLLDDLLTALGDSNESLENLNPYFLGSIVLVKGDKAEADVVDGQQRLTTLTILVATLRALVQPEYAEHLTEYLYDPGSPITGKPPTYRLTLGPRDAQFFQQYIQHKDGLNLLNTLDPATLWDSRRNIQANALLFRKRIGELAPEHRLRLAQFIVTRCFLVVVSTPDLESGYRIFSVLNDRGLDLTLTDILKAEIIGKIRDAQQEHYTTLWEREEEDLGREGFQELFTHIRMIQLKTKPRESVLREIRAFVRPSDYPQEFIDKTLIPFSDAFEIARYCSYESDQRADKVNDLFRWLNQIDNIDWFPPAVLYLAQNRHNPDSLINFLTDLERLAAGLMIRRANVNERFERYGRLLTAIEQDLDLYHSSSPLQLTASDRQDIVETLNHDIYTVSRIRQYVLLRLDSALASAGAKYDYPVISIEHVLPQNPRQDSQWMRWFPNPEQRAHIVHRLGNLVLLSRRKNAQAHNFEFEYKKKKYFAIDGGGSSPFVLTTSVLQENEWTPAVIERRQSELVSKLKQLWRL